MQLRIFGQTLWRLLGAVCALAVLAGQSLPAHADLAATVHFEIPPQPLPAAIIQYSQQSGVQVSSAAELLDGRATAGVNGSFPARDALLKLLAGTDLAFDVVDSNTIAIRLAPTVSGKAKSVSLESGASAQAEPVWLDEVAVVGSRIPQSPQDSAVPIEVYNRQKIDASGASTLAQFLNTLPEASVQSTATGQTQHFAGSTTIQLHGLPAGTTLVLINGRRVESAMGTTASYFDLNQIPMAAIDRIEVLSTGSSAIYGGDGLGGVVNIVLKQGFEGIQADVRHGETSDGDYHETQYSLAAGWKSDRWTLSAVGLYANNNELSGNERALTANANYTAFGGKNTTYTFANPGNVCTTNGTNLTGLSASCAGIPKGSTGVGLTPADFASTAGIQNRTTLDSYASLLAPSSRAGTFISGTYQLQPQVQLFMELLYNHLDQSGYQWPPISTLSVAATNPYNPFHEAVNVSYMFSGLGRDCYCESADYLRPLLGARGSLPGHWDWEVAGWTSRDWESLPRTYGVTNTAAINAAVANGTLNPFQDGPGATPAALNTFYSLKNQDYRGAMNSVNGFIRGPLLTLASGTVEAVVGGEYEHDSLESRISAVNVGSNFDASRESEAAFAEVKVPIIGSRSGPAGGDMLSAQLAVRYDRYSDFGDRTSPGAGLEFRPVEDVLLRASYSSSYKPPSLSQLDTGYVPSTVTILDPLRGGQSEAPALVSGGNPNLKAETGWSRNFGVLLSPAAVPGLTVSLTNWAIRIENGFITPSASQVVNFPTAFP